MCPPCLEVKYRVLVKLRGSAGAFVRIPGPPGEAVCSPIAVRLRPPGGRAGSGF